ncbi:Thermostable 8-oxoguanine DNA glycosylase [Clostridium amylolyticum]|uniref:Thermostable 8-oxoguanine DNA glycosylase n=1 Tax=Clostridium amylolyticum TaxID=1121298 RepID=A0A1M6KDL9_9CLOT|nr:hypothetical protein [Clostridium amylolyticum]SHJ57008.1 Thermostable 8-oxoguanine DNA glycosylase [Clostridium amylolyticum]
MVSLNAERVLDDLWQMYGGYVQENLNFNIKLNNTKLIEEFFFIVLGGFGISYELNISALRVLKHKKLLNSNLFINKEDLIITSELLKNEFNTKQFEPRTKSSELRKYRFIDTKSITVAEAGYWLWSECQWNIDKKLQTEGNKAREWLCNCPGVGLKSASWLLRNIGYCENYAVLDVHILRFISKMGIEVPKNLSEKSYLYVEDTLRNLCDNIGVTLGKMDYLLWTLGRCGYLEHVRCE